MMGAQSDDDLPSQAPTRRETPGPLRALMILGSSSLVTIIAGLASSKIAAVMIGSEGVGLMALVLLTVSVANTLLSAGIGQALIRQAGADEASGGGPLHPRWVYKARKILLASSVLLVGVSVALSPLLSQSLFGADAKDWWLGGTAIAAVFYAWSQLELNTLIAHHLVSATARVAVAAAFVSPGVNAAAFAAFGVSGVVPGAVVANGLILVITSMFVRRRLALRSVEVNYKGDESRRLLRDGLPLIPVALLGSLAVLVLLLIVDRQLSREDVGYFRAASIISVGYVAFISVSITKDFFPRISRTVSDEQHFATTCDQQIRMILHLAAPVVIALNVALPVVVPVLFSREFAPTVDVLEWQIAADLIRFVTTVLATALLVKAGSVARLAPEMAGAASFVGFSLLGLSAFGFRGLGIGYVWSYLFYMAVMLFALSRYGYRPSGAALGHLGLAFVGAISVPIADQVVGSWHGRLIGVPIAIAFGAWTSRSLDVPRVFLGALGRMTARSSTG